MTENADSGIPYIGSPISLISKADIRYEGILYHISMEEGSITLHNVRIFGTEGRKDGPQVPASVEVYEFIVFKGDDIKDLTRIQANLRIAAGEPGQPLHALSQVHLQQQPPLSGAKAAPARPEPGAPPAAAPTVSLKQEQAPSAPKLFNYAMAAGSRTAGRGPGFQGQGQGRGQAQAQAQAQAQQQPQQQQQHQQQQGAQGGRGGAGTGRGAGGNAPYYVRPPPSAAAPSTPAQGPPGQPRPAAPSAMPVPQEDFDFDLALKKFNKDDIAKEQASELALNASGGDNFLNHISCRELATKPAPMASGGDDFFDAISCEALESGGRTDWRHRMAAQRNVDMETFGGLGGVRQHHSINYRGRGSGGGGGGRGGAPGVGGGRGGVGGGGGGYAGAAATAGGGGGAGRGSYGNVANSGGCGGYGRGGYGGQSTRGGAGGGRGGNDKGQYSR
eukprot:gene3356-13386_t